MAAPTSEADFAALLRRAGLALSPAQQAGIHPQFAAVEAMLSRLRRPLPNTPAAAQTRVSVAEPATTFRAELPR